MLSHHENHIKATSLEQEALLLLNKIANILREMRRVEHLPISQQNIIASQAKHIYAPIAHRLGLGDVKAELEDIYLRFYAAPVYHSINQLLGSNQEGRRQFITKFRKPLEATLQ